MRKRTKVILSLLLMLTMLFTWVTIVGAEVDERKIYQNEDFIYEVLPDNTVTVHFYTGTAEKVSVPSSIDGVPVVSVESMAFYGTDVKEVVISEGITTIKDEAFFYSRGLESVTLPESLENVGIGVFRYCTNLKEVTFAENCEKLGDYIFYGCTNLESVELPRTVTSIPTGMFSYCQSLRQIDLPEGLNTISDYAFYASGLETVELPLSLEIINEKSFAQSAKLAEIISLKTDFDYVAKDAFDGCIAKLPGYSAEINPSDPTETTSYTDPSVPTYPKPPDIDFWEPSTGMSVCGSDTTEPSATGEPSAPSVPGGFATPEGFYIGGTQEFLDFENTKLTDTEDTVRNSRQELSELAWNVRTMGDANNDQEVNIRDATQIQRFVASLIDETSPYFNYKNSDVDTDGKVTVRDATRIQKYIAGLIKTLY